MSDLLEDPWILISVSAFVLVWYVALEEVFKENSFLHGYVIRRGNSSWTAHQLRDHWAFSRYTFRTTALERETIERINNIRVTPFNSLFLSVLVQGQAWKLWYFGWWKSFCPKLDLFITIREQLFDFEGKCSFWCKERALSCLLNSESHFKNLM